MKTDKELLQAAKAVIADKKNWTTGCMARDLKDGFTTVSSADACKFCALGAIARVSGTTFQEGSVYFRLQDKLAAVTCGESVAYVNDTKGFNAVHSMFDAAIAAEE